MIEQASTPPEEWLEGTPHRGIVVTETLDLLWMNAAARRDLEQAGDMTIRDDRLIMIDSEEQQQLASLVERSLHRPQSHYVPAVERGSSLLIRARRIDAEDGRAVIGITYARSDDFRLEFEEVAAAFGLTHSEYLVTAKLMEGLTADQIARVQGLSLETVRTHIRRIYVKLKVTSREGMFNCLRPFTIPVDSWPSFLLSNPDGQRHAD